MTIAPPLFEHAYLGESPHELIPSPFGVMERWRVQGMLTGETGALIALRDHVRNDAISALDEIEQRERTVAEREARCDQREHSLAATAARLNDEIGRATEQWDRLEQARADQQREQEEPLPAPPSAPAEPAPGADDDTPAPSGELHAVAAKQEPDLEEDAALPGDLPPPPAERSADQRGEFLRLSHPVEADETEFPDPELPKPPEEFPQPIAAGLDAGG